MGKIRFDRSLKAAFSRPYVYLLLIGLIFLSIYLYLLIRASGYLVLQDWLSRLTVTIFGSYLVVILVDASFRQREREEKDRVRYLFLEQLRKNVNFHTHFLISLYVASLPARPDEVPDSHEELLTEGYIETIQHLDLSETRGKRESGDRWYDYLGESASIFQDDVNEVLGRYAPFLDSETLTTFQELSNSEFLYTLSVYQERDILLNDSQRGVTRDYNLFAGDGFERIISEHLQTMLKVVEYYELPEAPDLKPVSRHPEWRDDVHPMFGSARIEKPLEMTNPKLTIGPNYLDYDRDSDDEEANEEDEG